MQIPEVAMPKVRSKLKEPERKREKDKIPLVKRKVRIMDIRSPLAKVEILKHRQEWPKQDLGRAILMPASWYSTPPLH